MEEHAPGAVVFRSNEGTLHVGNAVVGTVEVIQYFLGQKFLVFPLFRHVAVKTDIAGKNNRGRVLGHARFSRCLICYRW